MASIAVSSVTWPWPLLKASDNLKYDPWQGQFKVRDNYKHWEARFKVFVQALYPDLWSIITSDCTTSIAQKRARAMYLLYITMDEEVFGKIYTCESAYEIWQKLRDLYKQYL